MTLTLTLTLSPVTLHPEPSSEAFLILDPDPASLQTYDSTIPNPEAFTTSLDGYVSDPTPLDSASRQPLHERAQVRVGVRIRVRVRVTVRVGTARLWREMEFGIPS